MERDVKDDSAELKAAHDEIERLRAIIRILDPEHPILTDARPAPDR